MIMASGGVAGKGVGGGRGEEREEGGKGEREAKMRFLPSPPPLGGRTGELDKNAKPANMPCPQLGIWRTDLRQRCNDRPHLKEGF